MAKFTPGPAVAAVSGSVGGTVFSRNRYGAYMRFRAIPVTSTTTEAQNAKNRVTAASQAWQGLTAAQRLAWKTWANTNPVTDALGFPQVLAAQAAYVGNSCLMQLHGITPLLVPPVEPPPLALVTGVQDGDIGTGDVDFTFTATPLGASEHLHITAAVVDSAGIVFVKNLLRYVGASALAETSPFDDQSLIEARFGALIVGQSLHVQVAVFDTTTGLLSAPIASKVIITTT